MGTNVHRGSGASGVRRSIAAGRDMDLEGQASRSDHVEVAAQGEVVGLAHRQNTVGDGGTITAERTVVVDLEIRSRTAWGVAHQHSACRRRFDSVGGRIDMQLLGDLWNSAGLFARCLTGHVSIGSNEFRHDSRRRLHSYCRLSRHVATMCAFAGHLAVVRHAPFDWLALCYSGCAVGIRGGSNDASQFTVFHNLNSFRPLFFYYFV